MLPRLTEWTLRLTVVHSHSLDGRITGTIGSSIFFSIMFSNVSVTIARVSFVATTVV